MGTQLGLESVDLRAWSASEFIVGTEYAIKRQRGTTIMPRDTLQ